MQISIANIQFVLNIKDEKLKKMVVNFFKEFFINEKKLKNPFVWTIESDEFFNYKNLQSSPNNVVGEFWYAVIDINNKRIVSQIKELKVGYLYALLCGVYFKIISIEKKYLWCHSCGIIKEKGYIFAGVSGAGKTTIANKSLQYDVLSDETIILEIKENNQIVMHGTPFSSFDFKGCGKNLSKKISAIFFISHSKTSQINKISSAKAFFYIMQTNSTNTMKDYFLFDRGDNWSKLIKSVPCYEFKVNIKDDIWEVIKNENL